jgi:hypothetical protein
MVGYFYASGAERIGGAGGFDGAAKPYKIDGGPSLPMGRVKARYALRPQA